MHSRGSMVSKNDSAGANHPKTFVVRIKRQDGPGEPPYWHAFELAYRSNLNMISVLQEIAAHPVTIDGHRVSPPVWEASCLEEVCGSCTMLVNDFVRQACSTLADEALEGHPHRGSRPIPLPQWPQRSNGPPRHRRGEITLAPMTKFPVIRDLHVDRSRMFRNLERFQAWVPIDDLHDRGAGPRENRQSQELRYALSRCMTCGCCLEACPQFTLDNQFVGAQMFAQVLLFNLHETGKQLKAQRLELMSQAGGISDCGNAQNCVKVCPQELPLTEAIARIGQQTMIHQARQSFSGAESGSAPLAAGNTKDGSSQEELDSSQR